MYKKLSNKDPAHKVYESQLKPLESIISFDGSFVTHCMWKHRCNFIESFSLNITRRT